MFPLIPVIAVAAMLGGGATLYWYSQLSEAEQTEADQLTAAYAAELFGKAVDQLTVGEARQVHALVRQHFDN
jgi:hypothetical protein